jgi:hypothetical protein
MNPSNRLKLLNLARRRLGLDEDSYRAILASQAGVTSGKLVVADPDAFERVMAHLRKLGFRSDAFNRADGREPAGTMATAGQIELIRKLWIGNSGKQPGAELDRWIEQRFKVSSLRFVTFATARKLIGALRAWEARKAAKARSKPPSRPPHLLHPLKSIFEGALRVSVRHDFRQNACRSRRRHC